VWFIGDGPIDVACGAAAGCTTVLVHGTVGSGAQPPHGAAADCAALQALIAAALANASH
jgi:phosphoglycolate phosphatase-like HAD superfamily hydrolase